MDEPQDKPDTAKADAVKKQAPKAKTKPAKQARAKRAGEGITLPGAAALSVLAAGAGALGGAALSRLYLPTPDKVDLAPIEQSVSDLSKSKNQLEAKLNRLETTQSQLSKPSASEPIDLGDIYDRLESLERAEAPSPDLSGVETRLSALEAGTVSDEADIDFSRLYGRLDALEAREDTGSEPVDLSDIEQRLSALEARATSVPAQQIRTIPPFPRQAVLDALEQDDAGKKRNWFQRAIDSQITIVDDEHLKTVDTITTLLEQGDIEGALDTIDNLPPRAQDALAEWMASVTGESTE